MLKLAKKLAMITLRTKVVEVSLLQFHKLSRKTSKRCLIKRNLVHWKTMNHMHVILS